MRDFDYDQRAAEANAAHAELDAAFACLVNRNDQDDPRTQRWLATVQAFGAALARAYPEALRRVANGEQHASALDTKIMLDFVEADPIFHRSGYLKEKLLRQLKRRDLSDADAERLRRSILAIVRHSQVRREFFHYCRAAANVDSEAFRRDLEKLEQSGDRKVQCRANWVMAALSGTLPDRKRALRTATMRAAEARVGER